MWEKQKRGLAHLHGVISVESPAHVRWAEAYVTALREMAPRYGFGFVDGWHKVGRKFWPGAVGRTAARHARGMARAAAMLVERRPLVD